MNKEFKRTFFTSLLAVLLVISNLIGLSKESDPSKIEQDLIKIFPKEYLKDINHLFVWHGRNTCVARKPKCDNCAVKEYCKHYKKTYF